MPRFEPTWDFFPPPSTPLPTTGGIKLQATGRDATWWAKRWLSVLEQFELGSRLTRGRSYARKGQVLDMHITPGQVRAQVQGSRPQPYTVSIGMRTLTAQQWEQVVNVIAAQAAFAAQLLSGVMPQDIEEAFTIARVPLFPKSLDEITTDCSCPDWSNPCKHIAAVYYLLGQEFDRDAFLLFTLRGLTREGLLTKLGAHQPDATSAEAPSPAEPLPTDPIAFWHGDASVSIPLDASAPPPVNAPLVRQLGPFPFWRGETDLRQTLESGYQDAVGRAQEVRCRLDAREG